MNRPQIGSKSAELSQRDERADGRRLLHRRLRPPHRAQDTLSSLRTELKSLYQELSEALLPNGKGKK